MDKEIKTIVEGILFAMGDPVEVSRFAFALEKDIKTTGYILDEIMKEYNDENRGTKIIKVDDAYQMATNSDIFSYLIKVAKQPKKFQLTQAVLETLAIIAYKQPVTKLDIEKIRGVNSDYSVNKLLEYELIYEKGRSETVGRPILFATTKKFLRVFSLTSLEELNEKINIDDIRKKNVGD